MEYILKVSPKGQVTLPKKLRKMLGVNDLVEVEVKGYEGVFKKPEGVTEKLAGCFKRYALIKKVPVEKALEQAAGMVAHEIAKKSY